MAPIGILQFILRWSLIWMYGVIHQAELCHCFNRYDFPRGFVFGAGSSAFQVEGSANIDGRKPSIWDVFTHQGKMIDKSTADVSADQYHHYREDIEAMAKMGLDAYRFSISWSRLIPDGRGAINPKGLEYYNNVIDELLKHGIEPHVTLFHFDTPYSLELAYSGWLQPNIITDFTTYAEVCFKEFGDRVKHWTTFNEVNVMPQFGYDTGTWPPQRCSAPFGDCTAGNSTVEPYIVGYHMLLAHAHTVSLYRSKYQPTMKGWIGISYYVPWCEPFSNSSDDVSAAQRALDFQLGWLLEPLIFGDYPSTVKQRAGSRLKPLARKSQMLKEAFDFIGIMHYTTFLAKDSREQFSETRDFTADMGVQLLVKRDGILIGNMTDAGYPVVPRGMQAILEYIKQHYNNPPIIIYENGYGQAMENLTQEMIINDEARIQYQITYLENLLSAIRNGSNTTGYFVWSLVDQFEFFSGYRIRYGLFYVDFSDESRARYPKLSAQWYSKFLKKRCYLSHLTNGKPELAKIPMNAHNASNSISEQVA